MVDFLNGNGTLTPEGAAVVAYLDEQVKLHDDPADKLKMNQASGPVRMYWVNVKQAGMLTETEFVRDYNYAAGAIWSILEAQKAAETNAQQTQESQSALVAEMTKLREMVEAQAAELAALKEASKPAPAPKKKADKPAEDDAESEA